MITSMQGNWTISVKSISASFPQRFIVSGASTGNGTYDATTGMANINVTGQQWSIAIMNNPGKGFQMSDSRITFPVKQGNKYLFDIESNDAGKDKDFNDLILTCSSPVLWNDFLIYGHVTSYSGLCLFNPCYPRWVVIETPDALLEALKHPQLGDIIRKLYPERIPPIIVDPFPPDPPPYFKPLMINILDNQQLPDKVANLFNKQPINVEGVKKSTKASIEKEQQETFQLEKSITLTSKDPASLLSRIDYDHVALGRLADNIRFGCYKESVKNLTLNFQEYDRTNAEMAGGTYTGTGDHTLLGSAVTDMNGNYIFRFQQSFTELVQELFNDVASGENYNIQVLPDVIVSIKDINPAITLFESAPYFNIPRLKRIDLCLPKAKIPQTTSLCDNGNLIGSLGNIALSGVQNATGLPAARTGLGNTLTAEGKISVGNPIAGFSANCACWVGKVDIKGCMLNKSVVYYTIRYKKPGDLNWEFVKEPYLHPRFSKRFIPGYMGDLVGPFDISLKIDGGPSQLVKAYNNIQRLWYYFGEDWEWDNLSRYMQLNTSIYEMGTPGTVHFKVEGYDAAGKKVVNAEDFISLYIDNQVPDYALTNAYFTTTVADDCVLFTLNESQLADPLRVFFRANEKFGFLNSYYLRMGKGKFNTLFATNDNPAGAAKGQYNAASDHSCTGYVGTRNVFGDLFTHSVELSPSGGSHWLPDGQDFCTFTVNLSCVKRQTNGYNSGLHEYGSKQFIFGIQKSS